MVLEEVLVADATDAEAVEHRVMDHLAYVRAAHRLVVFHLVDMEVRRALEVAPHAKANVGLVAPVGAVRAVVERQKAVLLEALFNAIFRRRLWSSASRFSRMMAPPT